MEQQGTFPLLPEWDASPSQGYPGTQQKRFERKNTRRIVRKFESICQLLGGLAFEWQ